MSDATYEVLEFRAVVKPHWTELYVFCGPTSDGTIGVQGWHKRVIEPDVPALDALTQALTSYDYLTSMEWSQAAPGSDR